MEGELRRTPEDFVLGLCSLDFVHVSQGGGQRGRTKGEWWE
jgi:hypothetical protein